MSIEERLVKRLERLARWAKRYEDILNESLSEAEHDYLQFLKVSEEDKTSQEEKFRIQAEQLKNQLDNAVKEITRKRYLLEKESGSNKEKIAEVEEELAGAKEFFEKEQNHLKESKIKLMASYSRQMAALEELYGEKKTQLLARKDQVIKDLKTAQNNYKNQKLAFGKKDDDIHVRNQKKLKTLQDQYNAKKEGWEKAREVLEKEVKGLVAERETLEKKLSSMKANTEDELATLRDAMNLSKEQLEIDKVTLIEKAESDQRQCEKEIRNLTGQVQQAEKELQDYVVKKEDQTKNEEDMFERDEKALKEAVRTESEKRDYEQKLYKEEKSSKLKELGHIKEEYEKRKWYWDNQVRNQLMQKGVQEAEFNSEKLRVDREARVALKSLEVQREELKQRLNDLKSKHENLLNHEKREKELREHRWSWRKDRLWSMWEKRLKTLKKERETIHSQLEALQEQFLRDQSRSQERESQEQKRMNDLQADLIHTGDRNQGFKKQRQIQLELEKTRILAQIKECETLIIDWKDRLKNTQKEIDRENGQFRDQYGFLEKFYKAEEHETDLFLGNLKSVLQSLEAGLDRLSSAQDAAA